MNLADKPPCKTLVGEFIETLTLEAQDLGVEIRLNTPGTVELCRELGVCGVIIAAGGNKIVPQVPGIEKAYNYDQVLNKGSRALRQEDRRHRRRPHRTGDRGISQRLQ
jgi:hypothetical protein